MESSANYLTLSTGFCTPSDQFDPSAAVSSIDSICQTH